MVFLTGPPNRGRGSVMRLVEQPLQNSTSSISAVDPEANEGNKNSTSSRAQRAEMPHVEYKVGRSRNHMGFRMVNQGPSSLLAKCPARQYPLRSDPALQRSALRIHNSLSGP